MTPKQLEIELATEIKRLLEAYTASRATLTRHNRLLVTQRALDGNGFDARDRFSIEIKWDCKV